MLIGSPFLDVSEYPKGASVRNYDLDCSYYPGAKKEKKSSSHFCQIPLGSLQSFVYIRVRIIPEKFAKTGFRPIFSCSNDMLSLGTVDLLCDTLTCYT
jgi:hypothetical protein